MLFGGSKVALSGMIRASLSDGIAGASAVLTGGRPPTLQVRVAALQVLAGRQVPAGPRALPSLHLVLSSSFWSPRTSVCNHTKEWPKPGEAHLSICRINCGDLEGQAVPQEDHSRQSECDSATTDDPSVVS